MQQEKWISVAQYAKMVGKSVQQVYMDIRLGKIKNWKMKEKVTKTIQIKID